MVCWLFYFIEPPRIFGKRKFHANVGEAANVICESRGNPEPKFTWSWKDSNNDTVSIGRGEEISSHSVTTVHGNATSRSTLEIKDVTTESWTIYTCEVVNTLGRDTAEIALTGNGKFCFKSQMISTFPELSVAMRKENNNNV